MEFLIVALLSSGAAGMLTLFICTLMIFLSRYETSPASNGRKPIQVLVLGDIGRSPRMQYHALSIVKHGGLVEIIGYHESPLLPGLMQHPSVRIYALAPPPPLIRSKPLPFVVTGPLKVIWQILNLIYVLGYKTSTAQWLLVQSPPSIPTLAVAAVTCTLRNTRLLIDWHNYGWTILAGTRGVSHPFVRVSKLYERFFGRIAPTANLTVTHAMARQLKRKPYNITTPIFTLHDRPAAIFQPILEQTKRRECLEKLDETKDVATDIMDGRLRLLVSGTSWTPDEDFSVLLDALTDYASSSQDTQVLILAIITGQGPQKAAYEAKIRTLTEKGALPGISIRTAFLAFEDYASLLASADLGVCLHTSSSGVDLPMKVVDMFGAGLPVVAYSGYESFPELVKEGTNGMGFETRAQLTAALEALLGREKEATEKLAKLKEGAVEEGRRRWDEEWNKIVAPVLGLAGGL